MNEDLNVIIWILLIAGLIISTIFTVLSIYDYSKDLELKNQYLQNSIIKNCTPSLDSYDRRYFGELIRNDTHIFQHQTCKWLLVDKSITGVNVESWVESLLHAWD